VILDFIFLKQFNKFINGQAGLFYDVPKRTPFYFCAKVLMQETQTVCPSRVAMYLFPQEQTKTVLRVGL